MGNRIAAAVIAFGQTDGSNEANNYADTTGYMPVNPPQDINATGINTVDPNRWQPLIINGLTQQFLTPQWGGVTPFALATISPTRPYFSAAQPPQLGGLGDAEYKAQAQRLIRYSSWLDPSDGVVVDVSPRHARQQHAGHGGWVGPLRQPRDGPAVRAQRRAARRLDPRCRRVLGGRARHGDAAGALERPGQRRQRPAGGAEADRRRRSGRRATWSGT